MESRYQIREQIGSGGLGTVFKAFDSRMNRVVAIKRIPLSTKDPELQYEATNQLIKEAGALASLQHPHIVTIHDVGSDEKGPYVVMELLKGKSLEEIIENAPLTWTDFKELVFQTQEALIGAHELDMIHCDIKPANLMLSWLPSGKFQVKIVDFGLSNLIQNTVPTKTGAVETVFGTIFYMPPEQLEQKPLDARSDLYSMGCVYYRALAGINPFNGRTVDEVMNSHLNHRVVPLQELRPDVPSWACDWVMWLMNREPSDRPESARYSLALFIENEKYAQSLVSIDHSKHRMSLQEAAPAPLTAAVLAARQTTAVLPMPSNAFHEKHPYHSVPPTSEHKSFKLKHALIAAAAVVVIGAVSTGFIRKDVVQPTASGATANNQVSIVPPFTSNLISKQPSASNELSDTAINTGAAFHSAEPVLSRQSSSMLPLQSSANTLPLPWSMIKLGSLEPKAYASHERGTFSISSTGAIGGKGDTCSFVNRLMKGNLSIQARIVSLGESQGLLRSGIMIREARTSSSKSASIFLTNTLDFRAQIRQKDSGDAKAILTQDFVKASLPYAWVRIERLDDVFSLQMSNDGSKWIELARETIIMPESVWVGFFASSGVLDKNATSEFSEVNVTGVAAIAP